MNEWVEDAILSLLFVGRVLCCVALLSWVYKRSCCRVRVDQRKNEV
jgi:hypothetical protein